jgi:hypothetical protein
VYAFNNKHFIYKGKAAKEHIFLSGVKKDSGNKSRERVKANPTAGTVCLYNP